MESLDDDVPRRPTRDQRERAQKARGTVEKDYGVNRTDLDPSLDTYAKVSVDKRTARTRDKSSRLENVGRKANTQTQQSPQKTDKSDRVWREAWSEWTLIKADLDRIISRKHSHDFDAAVRVCTRLENHCLQLFTDHVDLAFKNELVGKVWRTAQYPVIDLMRKGYKRADDKEKSDMSGVLKAFCDHLMAFYSTLMNNLQSQCGFDLKALFSECNVSGNPPSSATAVQNTKSSSSSKSQQRKIKLAIFVCHQCYIFMGDISRYSEELCPLPQWSRPRNYYLKSVQLLPKNGHPYNQLAVIAINSHRRLDAVYYYIRSLCSKNPFLSANDALTALFDETARKAQAEELKRKPKESTEIRRKKGKSSKKISSAMKHTEAREVWIMPGRGSSNNEMSDGKDTVAIGNEKGGPSLSLQESQDSLPSDPTELSRKLVNCFLIVHGKLFSRIGVETFDQSKKTFLTLLKAHLLQTTTTTPVAAMPKAGERLLMMITINVFSLHEKLSESIASDGSSNSYYMVLSLSFGLEFVTQAINCILCVEHMAATTDGQSHMLIVLLPCIRIWLNWLSARASDWTVFIQHPGLISSLYEFLSSLVVLLNRLRESFVKDSVEAHVLTSMRFWEDKMLAGFIPLGLVDEDFLTLINLTYEQHYHQNISRVEDVIRLGTALALNDTIPLVRETDTRRFTVTMAIEEPSLSPHKATQIESSSDEEENDASEEEEAAITENDIATDIPLQLQQLKLEKKRLSKQMKSHLQTEQTTQSLLNEAKEKNGVAVTIKPKHLVPDTNCFIDHLDSLKHLVDSGQFLVAVPLTVKAELDGLCKGSSHSDGDNSSKDISKPAQLAVDFISLQIGFSHLKVLTSQGNLLSSLSITTELTDKATNDDLILTSCLKLHERVDASSSDTHSVVLLTDDRNLRVKSHASHMPVKNVQMFMDLFKEKK